MSAQPTEEALPQLSCVILTQGNRSFELSRAIASIRAQRGDPIQVVLVNNGGILDQPPLGVEVIELPQNVGIPAGRNEGTRHSKGDVVIYLDDDGWLPDPGSADHLRRVFLADPRLAVASFRIMDPETGRTERRHVPRLRVGDPARSSDVTTFLGGACAIRRSVIDECGEFPGHFFYGHEETDFAWRALDARYRIRYDAGVLMHHPGGNAASRHDQHFYYNARNRVWLARRRLPGFLAILYVLIWTVLVILRERRRRALVSWVDGVTTGLRQYPGTRRVMSW